ncbi:MAG: patatin-like phospholipase family protein [Bacteroidales bacterium]|nr:patatin-like phospholipase family protein [Bacteroidales bacterium]
MKRKKTFGLALSGGGARGIAHLGILQALEENGVVPSVMSGTSMGALVAVGYALGFKPTEMLKLIDKEVKPFSLSNANLSRNGLFSMKRVKDILTEKAETDDFSVLNLPVYVTVTNMNTGKFEIHSQGKFIDYTIASASIPIFFKPVVIDEVYYVDGGLTKNMAAHILEGKCDIIIGVNVNHIAVLTDFKRMKDIASRTYHLAVDNTIRDELDYCNYIVDPPETHQFTPFDFNKAEEIYEVGYKEGLQLANHLKADEENNRSFMSRIFGKKTMRITSYHRIFHLNT